MTKTRFLFISSQICRRQNWQLRNLPIPYLPRIFICRAMRPQTGAVCRTNASLLCKQGSHPQDISILTPIPRLLHWFCPFLKGTISPLTGLSDISSHPRVLRTRELTSSRFLRFQERLNYFIKYKGRSTILRHITIPNSGKSLLRTILFPFPGTSYFCLLL